MTPEERKELKAKIETRIKNDGKFRLAARAWMKGSDLGAVAELPLLAKSVDALRALRLLDDELFGILDRQRGELVRRVDEQLERRREDLLSAAGEAGRRALRRLDYDLVDCFRVRYKRARVTLELGSEKWGTFDEADGRRVFDRVMDARSELDTFPFSRDAFFDALKDATCTARAKEPARDGKVPIRELYPLVVVERQLRDRAFKKQPSARHFSDYSMCQFIYDLARFGQSGWLGGRGERLCSRTPNMGTIAGRGAVTLPMLEGTGSTERSPQIAVLWIEKA